MRAALLIAVDDWGWAFFGSALRLLWAPCALYVALAIIAWVIFIKTARRQKRREEHRCLVCGYLLRGLPEARCPECGTAFEPFETTTGEHPGRGRGDGA